MTKELSAILCELAGDEPPREVRLFRAGRNATRKGTFVFDDAAAKSVLASAEDWGVRLSFDYAHAMLRASAAPDPAEAGKSAGTFRAEVRGGELWAVECEWTEAAAAKIRAREFRYLSPAFNHDRDGRVLELINVALTNIPATKNASPLVLDASAVVLERDTMKGLLAVLGLAADASEERAIEKAEAFRACVAELTAATGKTDAREAVGVALAWKTSHERAASLGAELTALRKGERDRLIDDAIKAGKLAPALRGWAERYGEESASGLRAYLETAPVVVKMDSETKPAADPAGVVTLSDDDKKVCAQLGIAEADYAKTLAAARGGKG